MRFIVLLVLVLADAAWAQCNNTWASTNRGGAVYSSAGGYCHISAGEAGQCLKSGGQGAPTWGECAAGGGAPTDATYITQTSNATLSNEQALSGLTTGIVKVTNGTGALSTAVAGDFPTLNQSTTGTAAALTANGANCSANQFPAGVTAAGVAEGCAALVDADIPNSITVDLAATATALAANPADCTAGQYATAIAASGALTCTADPNVDMTVVKLANDVGIAVSASYTTVQTVAMPNSKNVNITWHLSYIPTANTVGMQFTVESGDAANGNCVFTTYGIAGTAASVTANEVDIIPIQATGTTTDTASAAACNSTACLVDVACTLTTDASAQSLVLKAQLETGTSNANIKAGASYYTMVTN